MVPVRRILLKNYAKQFQPAFPFNPFYQRWPEISLEITSRTTIYQVFWGLVSKVFYSPVFDTINLSGGVTLDLLLFTMKEKNTGLRIVPCGTPLLILTNWWQTIHDYFLFPVTKKADDPVDHQ